MPVHNGGTYLAAAVESILAQTGVELELIVIDDHSTDSAISELPSDPRINVLSSPLRGIVSALNHGIDRAKYAYIARMDSDDIAHPNRLLEQLTLMKAQPTIDICGTKVEMFSDQGEIACGYQHYQQWINGLCHPNEIEREFFIESPIPHPSALFSRDLIEQLGGYHDSDWPEDYDLWCRALLAGKQFAKPQGKPLLRWRDHSQRLSRQDKRYAKDQFLRCKAYYLAQYLDQRNIQQIAIWGTGPTGLKLHDYLEDEGVKVLEFIDINPKLIDRQKRNKTVHVLSPKESRMTLKQLPFIIAAVSARGARQKIRQQLNISGLTELSDYLLAA